ncbi:hypothetical protein BDK51DRAFT_33647, partial [Blyttiomyces helicus]
MGLVDEFAPPPMKIERRQKRVDSCQIHLNTSSSPSYPLSQGGPKLSQQYLALRCEPTCTCGVMPPFSTALPAPSGVASNLKGTVILTVHKADDAHPALRGTSLKVTFSGREHQAVTSAHVQWKETTKPLIEITKVVWEAKDEADELLPEGDMRFPFEFDVPADRLPPSIAVTHGAVGYRVTAELAVAPPKPDPMAEEDPKAKGKGKAKEVEPRRYAAQKTVLIHRFHVRPTGEVVPVLHRAVTESKLFKICIATPPTIYIEDGGFEGMVWVMPVGEDGKKRVIKGVTVELTEVRDYNEIGEKGQALKTKVEETTIQSTRVQVVGSAAPPDPAGSVLSGPFIPSAWQSSDYKISFPALDSELHPRAASHSIDIYHDILVKVHWEKEEASGVFAKLKNLVAGHEEDHAIVDVD